MYALYTLYKSHNIIKWIIEGLTNMKFEEIFSWKVVPSGIEFFPRKKPKKKRENPKCEKLL